MFFAWAGTAWAQGPQRATERPPNVIFILADDLGYAELGSYAMCDGGVPDMDVYDAAAWLAPGPLSAISAERGSVPLEFPDFTRGRWKTERTTM